jgi:hypothetical protein
MFDLDGVCSAIDYILGMAVQCTNRRVHMHTAHKISSPRVPMQVQVHR